MIKDAIARLAFLCETIPSLLADIGETELTRKPEAARWSKKEVIGHLIDSAANNHHRFVRGQFDNTPTITYDQNKWNAFGYYNEIAGTQVILFWTIYNKQLVELISRIPPEKMNNLVNTGDQNPHTLGFLIEDYVIHLEHHLRQIVVY